jgi:hypothetical protein
MSANRQHRPGAQAPAVSSVGRGFSLLGAALMLRRGRRNTAEPAAKARPAPPRDAVRPPLGLGYPARAAVFNAPPMFFMTSEIALESAWKI